MFGLLPPISFAEEIDPKKVNEFIKAMEEFVNKNPNPYDYAESGAFNELANIFGKYKLNDMELLEVQNILTKDEDILEITGKWMEGNEEKPFNQEIWNKRIIFHLTYSYQLEQWQKNLLTIEDVLIKKILPVISESKNLVIVRNWISASDSLLCDIHNEKLHLSDENRNKFCDKFIEIFNDETKPDSLKISAIKAWTVSEIRQNKIVENIYKINKHKVLFQKTAYYFWDVRTQEVMDMMFQILQNTDKYSFEIVDGVLYFWGRASSYDDEVLINRLKNVLKENISIEKNEEYKKRYEAIIKSIEWSEEYKRKERDTEDVKK